MSDLGYGVNVWPRYETHPNVTPLSKCEIRDYSGPQNSKKCQYVRGDVFVMNTTIPGKASESEAHSAWKCFKKRSQEDVQKTHALHGTS